MTRDVGRVTGRFLRGLARGVVRWPRVTLALFAPACGQTASGADASTDRAVPVDTVPPLPDVTEVPPPLDAAIDAFDAPDVVLTDTPRSDAPFDVPYAESYLVDGSPACTGTVNDGLPVWTSMGTAAAVPAWTGGVIVPGHYVLTAIKQHDPGTPVTPTWFREAIDVSSTHLFLVGEREGGLYARLTYSIAPAGNRLNPVQLCPSVLPAVRRWLYTATDTEIVMLTDAAGLLVWTYTRQ